MDMMSESVHQMEDGSTAKRAHLFAGVCMLGRLALIEVTN